jgi:hypothetical protein
MTALRASGLLAASLVLVPAACTCPAELARAGTIPREEECRERLHPVDPDCDRRPVIADGGGGLRLAGGGPAA